MKKISANAKTLLLAIIVVLVILGINTLKINNVTDENTMKCIAENSKLFVSKTCGHCHNQKQILSEHLEQFNLTLDLFDMTDCYDETEICSQNSIRGVPTWIIDGEKHSGVKSIDVLKELTGC